MSKRKPRIKKEVVYLKQFPNLGSYIGSTNDFIVRMSDHRGDMIRGKSNKAMQAHYEKYGYPIDQIIYIPTPEELAEHEDGILWFEQFFFDLFKSMGFNMLQKGKFVKCPTRGTHPTRESIERGIKTRKERIDSGEIVYSTGENHWAYGTHPSDETIKLMSEAQMGKSPTPETRQKLSIANSGENSPNFGKKWSLEPRKEQSKRILEQFENGRTITPEHRQQQSDTMKEKYKNEEITPWNKGKRGIFTTEQLEAMSLSHIGKNAGENNWLYGTNMWNEWKDKYGETEANRLENKRVEKITKTLNAKTPEERDAISTKQAAAWNAKTTEEKEAISAKKSITMKETIRKKKEAKEQTHILINHLKELIAYV